MKRSFYAVKSVSWKHCLSLLYEMILGKYVSRIKNYDWGMYLELMEAASLYYPDAIYVLKVYTFDCGFE